eukprot:scaffold1492_cov257-Pinguiococcus_pyrenoidosus.AAC.7
MLRFNQAEPSQEGAKWKLLVLDEYEIWRSWLSLPRVGLITSPLIPMCRQARDVICPLYSVSGLRKQGVTLHLMLQSARECIPGAKKCLGIGKAHAPC